MSCNCGVNWRCYSVDAITRTTNCVIVYYDPVCLLGIFPSKSYRSHDSEASVLDLLIHCVLAHLSLPLDKIGASGNFGNFGGCHFCTVKFLMSGFVSN